MAARQWFETKKQPTLDPEKLIFIDESGMHPGMGPRRGWSAKGQPLFGPEEPYAQGKHVSMIAAMRLRDGICAKKTVSGGVKLKDFQDFVFGKLVPTLCPGDVVCWDNINTHKNKEVIAAIEKAGATIVRLPPYSPDKNPIEAAWGYVKDWVRKKSPSSVTLLKSLLRRGLDRIKPKHAIGWFRYCGY